MLKFRRRSPERRRDVPFEGGITLQDGRTLSYAEYGDAAGEPVFYFHGTPGSRLEPALFAGAAAKHHLRLIAIDRPGFGRSTFLKKRRFLDWPADVVELADALGIERFGIVGLSGGGPHVAACALRIGDRLAAAAIVSGAAPRDAAPIARARGVRRFLFRVGIALGRVIVRPGIWQMQAVKWTPSWALPRWIDPKVLGRAACRKAFKRELTEAFRHGARGAVHEYDLFLSEWGFQLSEIARKVLLWHGEADRIVPVARAHWVAEQLPNCRATFVPGGGHLMIVDVADEIFRAMEAAIASSPLDTARAVKTG